MADVASEIQKAIYEILTSGDFQAAAGVDVEVFDRIPQGARPPYIKIGQDDVLPDLAQGYDGREVTCTITSWAPGPGMTVLKPIVAAIEAALAPQVPFDGSDVAPFTLPSHRLVTWSFQGSRYADDLDGVSVKAATVIQYLTHPTT